ncbi:unnamed protein product [Spirodela intermedia]|uniref:BZIP domain-containing protein n=1 Tax=Spirodela intermedia TaxID=51605 RepID=A0A7I8IHY4_SPIIN|nr:unnamed protein product [Spirodela intermedia]CAA6656765.1 unnamed protein product [Spirodela intermedia]
MAEEKGGRSPPRGGGEGQEAEEPAKTVYFVPIYAVAIVDPNKHVAKGRLSPDDQRQGSVCSSESVGASQLVSPRKGIRGKATEPEVAVQQKRQKLIVMRKRGRIPEYDDDDPHKPTPKRLRNRMKAQKSRDKKKAYMTALESKVKELGKMNSELEERCLALQIENESMKNEILDADPAAQEKLMRCHENIQKEKEQHALVRSVENLANLVGSPENEEGGGAPGKYVEISDHEDAGGPEFDEEGSSRTAVDIQECALEKFVGGSDAEGSPSRYIEDNGQDDISGQGAGGERGWQARIGLRGFHCTGLYWSTLWPFLNQNPCHHNLTCWFLC